MHASLYIKGLQNMKSWYKTLSVGEAEENKEQLGRVIGDTS
jgi:hypothetical protein